MKLDILVRGQSNAILLMESDQYAAAIKLTAEVGRLLGFDGVTDKVDIRYEHGGEGHGTAYSGTALLGDWLQKDAAGTWQPAALEQSLLRSIAETPPRPDTAATAVLWLHSEDDSANANLTVGDWAAAVRQDAALVRGALGGTAATISYHFVSAHPYSSGTDAGHQAIRLGMERLAADPAFHADIAARVLDIDTSHDNTDNNAATNEYGGPHISSGDAMTIAVRAAQAIAEDWSAFAKPGSPVALAGGAIDDAGPQVVAASRVAPDLLQLAVRHDVAAGFAPLGPGAASGLGWSVPGAAGTVEAAGVGILGPDTLRVRFDAPLPQDGVLHYGYGYGRLAEGNTPGQGNAVYDAGGLPIWTPAEGVALAPAAAWFL